MKKLLLLVSVVLVAGCSAYPSQPPLQNAQTLSCEDISWEITNARDTLTEIDLIYDSRRENLVVATAIVDNQMKASAIKDANARIDQLQILQRQKGCQE